MAVVVLGVPNVAADVKLNGAACVAGAPPAGAVPAGVPNLNADWPPAGEEPACDWLPKVNGVPAPPPAAGVPPKLKAPPPPTTGGAAPAPKIDFFCGSLISTPGLGVVHAKQAIVCKEYPC